MEKYFVENFVVKHKRDRLLFEWNGKKRKVGISRFCHNAKNMLMKDTIIASGNDLLYNEIINIIDNYEVPDTWYIIAFNQTIDKISCTLYEALDLVLKNGMAAIIVTDSIAIVETEQCIGTPTRYILHTSRL